VNNFKLNVFTISILFSINIFAEEIKSKDIEKIEVQGTYIEGYGVNDVGGASRLDLSIIEIPQSVSVITNAQMNDFQLRDINSALDSVTGINVERIETDRTYYTARGFDITNFQIDGVGLPLTSGNNHADEDTAIYDRVEVIRGANGLMTGVGNPSATINFIRKRPTENTQINFSGTVASWNKKRIELDASTSITDDIAARFVVVKQKNDSYLDRYKQDKSIAYAFIDADLTENTYVSISHSYIKNDATGNNWGANPLFYSDGSATDFDVSTSTSADWSNWQVEKNNTVIELAHYFNESWSLRATYSHKTTDEDTELFYVYGTPDKETGLGLFGYASEYVLDDKHNLFDAYISGDFYLFGGNHQLVAGINYAKMSYVDTSLYDYTTGFGFPVMPSLSSWNGSTPRPTFADGQTGSDVINKQKAVYFTARFELNEDLHVITGGRYNDWQVSGASYSTIQDAADKEFIPYLGAVYQLTPELMAYSSYTETFLSQKELDIDNKLLVPVTGKSKEIGFKSEFFDGLLIGSIAYFDIEQSNLAKVDPLTIGLPLTEQRYLATDGISSHGFEVELAGQVFERMQVSLGLTDFNISGDRTVKGYTPSKLIKLAATYDIQFIEGLSIGANIRWQDDISREQGIVSEAFSNAGELITTEQNAYAVVNLMASYEFSPNLKLSFNANNITDEKYLNSLYWAQSFYGAPASYSATLNWRL